MRTPAPVELLDAWDAGWSQPGPERTRPLLHVAIEPDDSDPGRPDLGELSLGERDRLLVALRTRLFGPVLTARIDCPVCGVGLEAAVDTTDLLAAESPPAALGVQVGGYAVACRPLRSADLVDAGAIGSAAAARQLLVARAVLTAELDGVPVSAGDLPAEVVTAVAVALSEAEPLAAAELPIGCDACGAEWAAPLDINGFLWQEVDAWACRRLGEVHALARAYGWSEEQVLGLSDRRRRRYLELVADG
ncbi:MAG: hypothetical protein ACLGIF_02730 [Actinomycetes bacterium]